MRELNIIKASIVALRDNEAASKEAIIVLAVETVQRLHQHNDVDTLNSFILACSPANRRMVVSFAKAFTGHKIGEDMVGGRVKPYEKDGVVVDAYTAASEAFDAWVTTGQTIYQWAFTKRENTEAKPVDLAKAAEQFQKKAKKAMTQGASRLDVFEAATGGLFSADDMLMMLTAMVKAEEAAAQIMKGAAAKV